MVLTALTAGILIGLLAGMAIGAMTVRYLVLVRTPIGIQFVSSHRFVRQARKTQERLNAVAAEQGAPKGYFLHVSQFGQSAASALSEARLRYYAGVQS